MALNIRYILYSCVRVYDMIIIPTAIVVAINSYGKPYIRSRQVYLR